MYDYASILFSGKCNSKCPTCIGKYSEFVGIPENLDLKELRGLEKFVRKAKEEGIKYISLSGINADPQQYQFGRELIQTLRESLPDADLSIHTNGRNILRKLDEFNSYDRATLSFPSFNSNSYRKIMGTEQIDIGNIVKSSIIPIKLSMLLTEYNQEEVRDYIRQSKKLGINRIAIRKLVDKEDEIDVLEEEISTKQIFGNPIYQIDDVEVTIWNYSDSEVKGLYLFPDGSLRDSFRNQP